MRLAPINPLLTDLDLNSCLVTSMAELHLILSSILSKDKTLDIDIVAHYLADDSIDIFSFGIVMIPNGKKG